MANIKSSPKEEEIFVEQTMAELKKNVSPKTILDNLERGGINPAHAKYILDCAIATNFQNKKGR